MSGQTPIERAMAEAKSALGSAEGWSCLLKGKRGEGVIDVPAWGDWEPFAVTELQAGNIAGWARGALSTEMWDKWCAIGPTFNDIADFIERSQAATGEDLGESAAS